MSCSRAARRARVAAHRSSTKHVGRLFPGSILGLPAARETMGARAEVILASAPALELRLGRAQHHRVVPGSLPVAPAVSAILAGAKSDFMCVHYVLAGPARPGHPQNAYKNYRFCRIFLSVFSHRFLIFACEKNA